MSVICDLWSDLNGLELIFCLKFWEFSPLEKQKIILCKISYNHGKSDFWGHQNVWVEKNFGLGSKKFWGDGEGGSISDIPLAVDAR